MSNHNLDYILVQHYINVSDSESESEYDSDHESDSDHERESDYDSDHEIDYRTIFIINYQGIFIESKLKHEKIPINRDISYKKTNLLFETCNICYERMTNVKTKCNHDYCSECFSIYYSKNNENNECAYCREKLFNED
jgi:hypothetical protein